MTRAIVLLMDSFAVGATSDAYKYGDEGSNTLLNITKQMGSLKLPNLARLGLAEACEISCGETPNIGQTENVTGKYGCAAEISMGKDTPSGHWEIAGVPVLFEWGCFPKTEPCFPQELIDQLIQQADLPGVLGNKHASGTTIIEELGEEHRQTGKPIVYTSADSVFQIAAHEESFGLDRLYEVCHIARKLVDKYNVGRVIARPFIGESAHTFERTANRKDLATPPPAPTLLDRLVAQGGNVIAVGKTADIFAHQGISKEIKADGNMALFDATLQAMQDTPTNSLIFTNFVDFDSKYGHRRDVPGYAKALEAFDARLPELEKQLQPDDLVIITADHGCDPTQPGSDHTRENIPVLLFGPSVKSGSIGKRETFADIGETIAEHLGLDSLDAGLSFLKLQQEKSIA